MGHVYTTPRDRADGQDAPPFVLRSVRFFVVKRPQYFALTNYLDIARLARVTLDRAIERIQFCYPQVYHACHTRHDRARSSASHVSMRDSAILVHLDRRTPLTLSELAAHMDLSRSTLSEAVKRLESLGYVAKARHAKRDARHVSLVLTRTGVDAVRASSVLESRRLKAVLAALPQSDRDAAVAGLELLARACRQVALATYQRG